MHAATATAGHWYDADRVAQAGSVILRDWIAGGGAAQDRARHGAITVSNATDASGLSWGEAIRAGIFGPIGASWGPAVTDDSAMQVGTVYACLDRLSGAVAQLPLHEYTEDADLERARAAKSDLWWLLNESPTPAWTAAAWKAWIVRCVKLRGDQNTEIIRSPAGRVLRLLPHHPDCVVTRRVGARLRYDVWDVETDRTRGVDQDDMLHFSGFGFDGLRSVSAIRWAARTAVSSELGSADYMGKAVTEGGMPRVSLQSPNKVDPAQAKQLRDDWLAIYGGPDGSKLPLVLGNGMTAQTLSIKPVDLELLASRKFSKGTICEVLGVPPIIIGDSEKASSWGTGIEQVTRGWVQFSIAPMLAGWEEELNRKLFRRAGRFVEFSLAALLRGDTLTQAQAYRTALGGPGTGDGWIAVDEVRKQLNLGPLGGDAAQAYRAPRNTSTTTPAP